MRRGPTILLIPLLVMQLAIVATLIAGGRLPHLSVLFWPALLGLVAGAALARSSFASGVAHGMSAVYGTFTLAVALGSLDELAAQGGWRERCWVLAQRLADWIRAAVTNDSSQDALALLILLGALVWLLSYSAAWFALRSRLIWHAVLPSSVVLLTHIASDDSGRNMVLFLIVHFIAALAALSLSYLADKEEEWALGQLPFRGVLRGWAVLLSAMFGVVALLVSWQVSRTPDRVLLSTATLRELQKPVEELLARWNRLLAGSSSRTTYRVDSYPNMLKLEGPRTLTPELVMEVSAPAGRHYWRANSYDHYDGRAWQNTADLQVSLLANSEDLPSPIYQQRREVTADFVLYRGSDAVFSPNLPVAASLSTRAQVDIAEDGQLEIVRLGVDVPLLAGNRYTARGTQSIATANQLRQSPTTYPDWVRDRYLQVPPELPGRVRNLARRLVGDAPTAYDKAVRIERWLRDTIAYDENLPAPPEGVEASDYVLFEARRAYCNYYATAMVMLLRSLGVPARVAVGYALGEAERVSGDLQRVQYAVRDRDSHAWVEVFFPNYGWVEFEPTPSQLPLEREDSPSLTVDPAATPTSTPTPGSRLATPTPAQPTEATSLAPASNPTVTAVPPETRDASSAGAAGLMVLLGVARTVLLLLAAMMGLACVLVGGFLLVENFGLWRLPPVERAYALLTRYGHWLGIAYDNALTPYERAARLAGHMPQAQAAVALIAELYVHWRFAPAGQLSEADHIRLRQALREARAHLRRALVRARFGLRRSAPAVVE